MLKKELTREPGVAAAAFSIACSTPGNLGHVAGLGLEHEDEREELAVAELLDGALVRLVALGAGDREVLEPAVGELAGGVAAEDRQHDPGADHDQPVVRNEMREPGHG